MASGPEVELTTRSLGIVSDTHGLVRRGLLAALEGCELIVHAGDVGRPEVLDALRAVAPVVAVRGNVDTDRWAQALRYTEVVEAGTVLLYVLHDLGRLSLNPAAAGFAVVVSGHSHRPAQFERGGVLYINPGSAGPRRFDLPISAAILRVAEQALTVNWIDLSG